MEKREIKFRDRDKESKKIFNLTNISFMKNSNNRAIERGCEGYWGDNHRDKFSLDDIELMQYTGLKDSKGVEIYEGDIVKNDNDVNLVIYFDDKECGFRQSTNFKNPKIVNAPLYPQDRKRFNEPQYTNLPLNFNGKEVIGNIYENPELLKK